MEKEFETELNQIKEFVKNYKQDDTIEVSVENKILYVHGKRSYIPLHRVEAIHEEGDTLLAYGCMKIQGKVICEKEYIGRLTSLGLDQWPMCKLVNDIVRKIA